MILFSESSRCAYCHRVLDPIEWLASDKRATRDHIWPRKLRHKRPELKGLNLVWACAVCNLLKGDMKPDTWHAFISATPHWWTTPAVFERRLSALRRYYDPARPSDIHSIAVIAGIGFARRVRPMPHRTFLDSYVVDDTPFERRIGLGEEVSAPLPRELTLAELEAICVEAGTTIEEIDRYVVTLARELIELEQRPVSTAEIVTYADRTAPALSPLLAAIDHARSMEHRRKRGKRLTDGQRRKILDMLSEGRPVKDIAVAFGVTAAAIRAYKADRIRAVRMAA